MKITAKNMTTTVIIANTIQLVFCKVLTISLNASNAFPDSEVGGVLFVAGLVVIATKNVNIFASPPHRFNHSSISPSIFPSSSII